MKVLPPIAILLFSWRAAALITPTTKSAPVVYPARSTFAPKTQLNADAVAEVPKGGDSGGTASIPSEVFNLIKSIVGAGVLSLPAGRFSDWKNHISRISFLTNLLFLMQASRLSEIHHLP